MGSPQLDDLTGLPARLDTDMPEGIFMIGPDAVTGRFQLIDIEAGRRVTFEGLTTGQQTGITAVLARLA